MGDEELVHNLQVTILPETPFWNWTRILEYDRNITRHNTEINEDEDEDVTFLVIVLIGILLFLFIWIYQKYSKADRSM